MWSLRRVMVRRTTVIARSAVTMTDVAAAGGRSRDLVMVMVVIEMNLTSKRRRLMFRTEGVLGAVQCRHRRLRHDNGHQHHAAHGDDVPHPALEAMQH